MDVSTLLKRARSASKAAVRYRLGEGGFHHDAPGPARNGGCDCSGFVCWALGLSRITRHPLYIAFNGGWINTDSIVHDASRRTGFFERLDVPVPGCVIVYPKKGSGKPYGHIGIVTSIVDGAVAKVIHCSATNFRTTKDAIQETGPKVFQLPTTLYAWYDGIEP
jgi:hypothetical protein